ncbi:MAG TPA: AMP-binding protein, partial [Herpetosiphonaceae bacterium]
MSEQTTTTSGFALAPQQHHLWSLHGNAARTAYQAIGCIWLDGPLDAAALERSLATLVSQHEILRTVFRRLPNMSLPVQVILPASAPQLSHHSWSEQTEAEQRAALSRLRATIAAQPFAWEAGPLFRATLVTLSESRHCLLLHVPALYADALGMANLGRALAAAYGEAATDEPVQYADIAGVLNDVLAAPESEPGRAYWQQHTPPAISTPLPFEQAAPDEDEFIPQVLTTTLTAEQAEQLAVLAEAQDSSLPVLLLAAWKILLWHLTREPEIVVATAYDGRVYEGLDSVIGVFERHLPVQTALAEQLTFLDVLRSVEQSTTAVADWQEYYTGAQTPLAFAFDFVQQPEILTAGSVTFRMEPPEAYTSRFKIKLVGVQSEQEVALQLHFDSTLLSAEATARLADQLHTLLASIAAQPNAAIGELEVVSPADRDLLHSFNQTARPYPSAATLHQIFEAQAAATPDRAAVACGNQHLTFAELNARANRLAHFLQRQGLGVEARVGLCLPRSIEILVGVLGILKAGGAYVPLDPTYPVERLRYMLDESQVAAVITQAALREHLPAHIPIVALDTQQQQIEQEPATNPQTHVQPEQLAYIIYTSGSTGRPKGVMVQQRSVVNLATALQHAIYDELQP